MFTTPVRARTVLDVLAPARVDVFVVARPVVVPPVRETTPREAVLRDALFVEATGVVAVRAAVVFVVARDVTVRATFARVAVAAFVVAREDARGLVRDVPARPVAAADCVTISVGAIGSANTARIDNNVEQTKNAPASKKTVPMAFLQKSATLRLFINTLLFSGKRPENPLFLMAAPSSPHPLIIRL